MANLLFIEALAMISAVCSLNRMNSQAHSISTYIYGLRGIYH
jgi:hypothetical protein